MKDFKVALVVLEYGLPPGWVKEKLEQEKIEFVSQHCETGDSMMPYAEGADVVWLCGGSDILTAERLADLPQCGAIIRTGSGTDNIPISAATNSGVVVINTPDAHRHEVSDHTLGLLFSVARQIAVQDRAVRAGKWDGEYACPHWNFQDKILGLVGFGRIGQLVAQKLSGYKMRVLVYDAFLNPKVIENHGAQATELDELLAQSDIVSLNCPLTPDTHHLIGEPALRRMKSTAILINTARGNIVDETALVTALREHWIMAAGLDVVETEPPGKDHPLLQLDNVVITPHIGGCSDQSVQHCWELSVEAAIDLKNGYWPRSVVNGDVQPRWPLSHRDRSKHT